MTEAARAAAAAGGSDQPLLDRLVALLDLEGIEENIFRGVSPADSPVRVFGGQVAGQALVAAGRTVDPDRHVHSLHAYFIRGGDPSVPIVYEVDRTRDGRSFTTRRVTAIQHGKAIFTLSASFQYTEPGFFEHAEPMPEVPAPESLQTVTEHAASYGVANELVQPRPIDLRYVTNPPWSRGQPVTANQVWMRADGVLPDNPLLHVCVLTYASDMTLLDTALARHGRHTWEQDVMVASLDHALWFHRPFRADEWFLYDCASPSASGGRGLTTGRIFARDGTMLATVVQEGLTRKIGNP